MRTRTLVPLLLVLFALVAACGDGGSGGDDESSSEDGGDAGPFVELLRVVPDSRNFSDQVQLGNWAAAADVANEEPPEEADEVVDYLIELDEATRYSIPNFEWRTSADQSEEFEDQLGFHLGQIDASVVSGAPPAHAQAFSGRFDVAAIEDAIESDPDWSDLLEVVEHNGVEYFSWDDEPDLIGDPSPRDNLGRGGNMLVTEDLLLWSFSAETMEAMIDAREGEIDSLADNDEVRAVAQTLDDLGAFSGMIQTTDGSEYGIPFDGDEEDRPPGPSLAPYELLATGGYADGNSLFGVIILVNADEDGAETNVERLTEVIEEGESAQTAQPWSELIEIESIESQGSLTIATLAIENGPKLLLDGMFRLDSLYASSDD